MSTPISISFYIYAILKKKEYDMLPTSPIVLSTSGWLYMLYIYMYEYIYICIYIYIVCELWPQISVQLLGFLLASQKETNINPVASSADVHPDAKSR